MGRFKLTPAADSDLQEIWEYTEKRWGIEQADNYLRKLERRMTYLVSEPKLLKIERELAMVLDGKEYNLLVTKEIEDQVLIDDTFPKIIATVYSPAQFLHEGFAF